MCHLDQNCVMNACVGRKSRIRARGWGVGVGWDEMQIFAKALIGSGSVTRGRKGQVLDVQPVET